MERTPHRGDRKSTILETKSTLDCPPLQKISMLIISVLMETLPFEIGETAHALRRAFDRRAADLGVTRAQWKVMFRLARMPGLRQVELADMLDVEPITLCRIVDRLEEAALVERRRDPGDRRAWQLFLTPSAEPLNRQLRTLGDALIEEAFEGVSNEDIATARRVLARVRDNLAALPAPAKAVNQ